jgi:hypothetical protein
MDYCKNENQREEKEKKFAKREVYSKKGIEGIFSKRKRARKPKYIVRKGKR